MLAALCAVVGVLVFVTSCAGLVLVVLLTRATPRMRVVAGVLLGGMAGGGALLFGAAVVTATR